MRARVLGGLGVLLLGGGVATAPTTAARALTVTFEKVADTGTAIPGGTGSFTNFGRNPTLDGTNVAFRGDGEPPTPLEPLQQGIYSSAGGLHAVVDQGTAIPGGAGFFETFTFKPSIEGSAVAWSGDGSAGQEGVYQDTGGGASLVADRNTLVPGGQTGEFFDHFVFPPVRSGGEVVFHAEGDGGLAGPATKGLYRFSGGALSAVVDSSTAMPGAAETFDFLSTPDADAGAVAFRGRGASGFEGIYVHDGTLGTVADENTLAPSGLLFQGFAGTPTISDGRVAFLATDTGGVTGLFVDDGAGITLVADENTAIPEGGGATFNIFGNHAIDHDAVLFEGIGTPGIENGLYVVIGGVLSKIIDLGDTLDGKALAELEISREALSGRRVVFWARFTDGSEGVFLATIPEPGTAGLLGAALAALAAGRRRR